MNKRQCNYNPVFIIENENVELKKKIKGLKSILEKEIIEDKTMDTIGNRIQEAMKTIIENEKKIISNNNATDQDEKEYISGKITRDEYKDRLINMQGVSYMTEWLEKGDKKKEKRK